MEKFTKGEWIAYLHDDDEDFRGNWNQVIIGMGSYNNDPSNHYCAHKVIIDGVEDTDFEGIANAHLIAAAPDMYEMLESALGEMTVLIEEVNASRLSKINSWTETPPDKHDQETLHLIQCLLAKARGE